MKTSSNFTANDILSGDGYCLPRYLPAYPGFYSSVIIRATGEAAGYRTTKVGKNITYRGYASAYHVLCSV
jgi:hypothetical protein